MAYTRPIRLSIVKEAAMFLRCLSIVVVLGSLAAPSYAQTASGGITGVVTDASGSVLPGVTVTLTNIATHATRVVQTNESGAYAMPALPPGVYSLKSELSGFRAVERGNIEIQVGSAIRIPVTLEIGQMTDTVQVVADTPVIQTETASIGTVIDITQSKETEAALRESELRLRLALDAAKMGTFEADITANEARIDEQEAVLLGLPEGTRIVSADEMRKRIPLEDLDASDAKKSRLTEQHEAYHHEFRLTMRDGSVRWLSAYADVRSNRIFGVNFDVTQRKVAESALHESEARLRVATSGAALGVFEWDPITDQAVWENDRIYEIFGRSRGDGPVNKRELIANYLHPDDAPELETSLNEAMRSESNWRTTCRIKRQDGTRRWLQIDGRFEKAAPDKLPRLIGVITDITERKRLEERAARLSDRLLTIQEEERRNIAQELHDSTVQHLVAASLMMTTLRASPRSDKDKKSWDALEDSLGEAMKELRTFSYLMHPPVLHAQGLYLSLQHYIDGFADRSGLVTKLTANHKWDKFPVRLQRPVFRIVQEALANAYRHASASQVSVELRRIGGLLHVIVTDDGRGIERNFERRQHPSRPPGVGIRGIRMRLNRLGGRLRISRPRAGGTRIHAVLPVGDTFAHRTGRRP
jgi:PAS domain S-box-containing protein